MRLSNRLRWALYVVFGVLVVTGGWLVADRLKDAGDGETWQKIAANLLMVHGGTAMVALLLLVALGPLHVRRAWRSRMNRATGIAVVSVNTMLIVTAFGLYYLGSEQLRPWISDIHIGLGLAVPFLLAGHIALGRSRARRD